MSVFKDDEEIARRLHMAELALEEENAKRKANYEAEQMDADLARYYARLYLEQKEQQQQQSTPVSHISTGRNRPSSASNGSFGLKPPPNLSSNGNSMKSPVNVPATGHGMKPPPNVTLSNVQHQNLVNRNSPSLNGSMTGSYPDPYQQEQYQYHSGVDYHQPNLYPQMNRFSGSELTYSTARHHPTQVSPEYDRLRKEDITDQSMRLDDLRSHDRNYDSLLGYPKSHGVIESTRSRPENEIANPEPSRRFASMADIEYARKLQEKAFTNLQQNAHDSYPRSRMNTTEKESDEFQRHAAMLASHEYSLALKNLSASRAMDHRTNDEEIARKLQEMENQGLGRLSINQDLHRNSSIENQQRYGLSAYGHGPAQTYGIQSGSYGNSQSQRREDDDARLARLMQESNVSFNQLPLDVVSRALQLSKTSLGHMDSSYDDLNHASYQESSPQIRHAPPRTASMSSPSTKVQRAPVKAPPDDANINMSTAGDSRHFLPSECDSSMHSLSSSPSHHRAEESMKSENLLSNRPETPSESSGTTTKSPIASLLQSSVAIQKSAKKSAEKKGASPSTPGKPKKMGFLGFAQHSKKEAEKVATKSTSPRKTPAAPLSSFYGSSQATKVQNKSPSSKKSSVSAKSGSIRSSESVSSVVSGTSSVKDSNVSPPTDIGSPALSSAPAPVNEPKSRHQVAVRPESSSINEHLDARGSVTRGMPPSPAGREILPSRPKQKIVCAGCGQSSGSFLRALDKKYHPECFRCVSCNGKIDPNSQFKFTSNHLGEKHPHHIDCFVRANGIQCSVCRLPIPGSADGKVAFVKHPFFSNEHMCVQHAEVPHRRCSGCQRFEPIDTPFIDLMDNNRCVCAACCRTVVFDSSDAEPLWKQIIYFFEFKIKLPVWDQMRDIPILLVGSDELMSQMRAENSLHAHSTQILTAGLCLLGCEAKASIVAILCLSGLPRDLTLSILCREATFAWIKLHPKYDPTMKIPAQVEEGLAQLMAYLFLSEIYPDDGEVTGSYFEDADGPSDEKLRQYFKFTIERDSHEIYGTGYRRAAVAYRELGIEDLTDYIIKYGDFPGAVNL